MNTVLKSTLILLATALAAALPAAAQTTITYLDGATDGTAYDTTGNNHTLTLASGSATQSGVLSGTGTVTKTGAGNLTLSATNSYSGGTMISGGTLTIYDGFATSAASSRLGTGPVSITNGAQLSNGNSTLYLNNNVTVEGAGSTLYGGLSNASFGYTGAATLSINQGATFTVGQRAILGDGSDGSGTATVSGSGSSFSAGVSLWLGYGASTATGSFTLNDQATLNVTGDTVVGYSGSGTLTLGSGTIATVGRIGVASSSSSTGVLNLNNGSTLRVGGTNGFTSGSGTATVNFAGGTVQATGSDLTANSNAILAAGTTTTLDTNSLAITWSGILSGSGHLTKAGAGTLTLSGANTYTGNTAIDTGTLRFGASDTTLSYGGVISGAGNLGKSGSSTLTLTGTNTYTGTTAVEAGTLTFAHRNAYYSGTLDATTAAKLSVGSGATAGFGVGDSGYFSAADLGTLLANATFASGASLGIDTSNATGGTFTLTNDLTATNGGANIVGLQKNGAGNLTLTGANNYAGGTVLNAGTLTLGHATALGATSGNLTLNGGTLDLGTFAPTVGTATFNGGTFTNGTLDNATAFVVQTGTLSAALGGSAALTKTGTGTFTLSGANNYGGITTVSAGTLSFANRSAYYGGTLDAITAAKLSVASGATVAFGVGDTGYFSSSDLGTILTSGTFASGSILDVDTTNATAGTFTWDNAATGTLGLVKNGPGTLALSGTSSGTGNLTVNAGTLRFEGSAAAFPYATFINNGTVDFAQSNEVTLTVNETGTGALNISGGGTVTIAGGLLDGTGDLTISNGTLSSPSGTRNISRNVTVTGADSTLALGTNGLRFGTSAGEGSLLVSNGGTVTYDSTGTGILSALVLGYSIGDPGTVTVTGAGSTFTTASGIWVGHNGTGTLNITDGGVFTSTNTGTSDVGNFTSGEINLSGTNSALTTSGLLSLGLNTQGTGTVNIASGATLTADRLLLASASSATGTLNLNAGGTLIVSDATDTALSTGAGTATFNFAGGTLKSNGTNTLTVSSNATLAADTTSTFDTNGQAGTWSGILSGTGALTKSGVGTLTLSGANTTTGNTTISAGTLTLGHANALGGSTLTTATGLSFGSLDNATFGGLSGSQDLALTNGSAAAVALTVGANAASTTYTGILSGTGSLIKTGAGTLTLGGANTYSGGTTVSAGTLAGNTSSLQGNITNNAAVAFDQASAGTYAGVIAGSGSLAKSGADTLTLTQDNTYTGVTTITAGTLQLGTGGSTGSLVGNVANSGTLIFNRSLSQTYNGVVSGTGSVVSDGGVVAFSAAQTYTGATAIKSGAYIVLATSVDQGLSASTTVDIESGGFLDISNRATTLAGLTGAGEIYSFGGSSGHLTVNVGTGQSQTFSGELGSDFPNFAFTKSGAGSLTLSGTNTHTGGTTVSAGTLQLGAGGTTGSVAGNITNDGTVTFNRSGDQTYGGVISGSGGVINDGVILRLTAAQTYTGPTVINSGILVLPSVDQGLAASTTVAIASGAVVDISNRALTIAGLTGAGQVYSFGGSAGHLTVNTADGQNQVFSGTLGSTYAAFALSKSGTGTLTLSGSNTYTGATTISAGTLQLGSANALGATASVDVNTGATLDLNNHSVTIGDLDAGGSIALGSATLTVGDANDHILSGTISGSGGLTKTGAGTFSLTGSNTYTGATVISAGTLHLGESLPLASTSITIASGATFRLDADSGFTLGSGQTLGGAGTVSNGLLTVGSGATLAPGNSPGTLNAADTAFAAGGSFQFEVNDATGAAGTAYDLLAISGTLAITATSGSPFGIDVTSLTLDNVAGLAANFDSSADYAFTFVTTTGGITGFAADKFTLSTSAFTNPFTGTWSLAQSGNNLTLNYAGVSAIPEPSTYAVLLGACALAFAVWHKRRRA